MPPRNIRRARTLAIFFIVTVILIEESLVQKGFPREKGKQIVNFSTKRTHGISGIFILSCLLLLLPVTIQAGHSPPNFSMRVNYTPLFPGIQRMTLGMREAGEVIGVWRHTNRRSLFYVYRIRRGRVKQVGSVFELPPNSPPCFCFVDGRLWVALGPAAMGRISLSRKGWGVAFRFKTPGNVIAAAAFDGHLLLALQDKPGWFRLALVSLAGRLLWRDTRRWHGRGCEFAQGNGILWGSVDNWDGTSSTIVRYRIVAQRLAFLSSYASSAFEDGKVLFSGWGVLNGRPVASATCWMLSPYGMIRSERFLALDGNHLACMGDPMPFRSEKLASALRVKGGMDLLIQYEPNKETVAPMAVSVFHVGARYRMLGVASHSPDSRQALKLFMARQTGVSMPGAKGRFNPLPYRKLLLPWQWKAWREHVASTGHEGISGLSGDAYPLAHSWKAIVDPNPSHTVWACQATPADYLAGRVKGTAWPYIPFDQDLREPVCERCHPIRPGKPSVWSMYNVKMKGNQLTPDGMRAPEQ